MHNHGRELPPPIAAIFVSDVFPGLYRRPSSAFTLPDVPKTGIERRIFSSFFDPFSFRAKAGGAKIGT
jgi:hypothetical protein